MTREREIPDISTETIRGKNISPIQDPSVALKKGDLIDGRLEILSCLGNGATGIVFEALHRESGERLALKAPNPGILENARVRADFLREYSVTLNLSHPHLVQVHDIGFRDNDQLVYFTMELVSGGDLGELLHQSVLSKEKLPYQNVLRWMGQIAEAIAYLHDQGLVHQDIKPANIFLDKAGQAKLGDFGLAFMPKSESMRQRLTQTSVIGGTTYFMSPEQHRAIFYRKKVEITKASDVCAFGLTLYNLISGEVIVGEREYMEEFINDPDVAVELNAFLDRCLARKPEKRFKDGGDLLINFRRVLALLSAEVEGSPGRFFHRLKKSVFSNRREAGEVMKTVLDGGVELNMVWIPPGAYRMGSELNERGRNGSERLVEVSIRNGFWMCETPITQAQWSSVMGNNPSFFKGSRHPVEMVSWRDCQAFLERINETIQSGLHRLPTEAEWEYACRAGTITPFAESLQTIGWYKENAKETTHKVKTKKANSWGLYDMHGNVWEWCQDWYDAYPIQKVIDPTGPHHGAFRVLRGGGFDDCEKYCRSANRNRYRPENKNLNIGFRIVRTVD